MSHIDLSDEDVHDLVEVLEYRLHELQDELVHTDDRAFRAELRAASDRLEALRDRVRRVAAGLPGRGEPSPIAQRKPTTA